MKYLVLIIVLLILSLYFREIISSANDSFIDFKTDYGTGIGPWWAQGAGLNRGFNRCNCYGDGTCNCINNNPIIQRMPQYYFN
jgi:hypothetical protein